MKIAVATDDRIHIAKRTGRAAEFAIYDSKDGVITSVQYIKNDHNHHEHHEHHEHEHGHSHKEVVGKLKGVDLFLVTHLGPHFKTEVEQAGIPYKMIKGEKIDAILKEYI